MEKSLQPAEYQHLATPEEVRMLENYLLELAKTSGLDDATAATETEALLAELGIKQGWLS